MGELQGKANLQDAKRYGYQRLVVWRNAYILRCRIYEISVRFSRQEMKRVSQMRDAARSVKQNIQEGYARGSLKEYIQSLVVSRGSLAELEGDVQDCRDDGLITDAEFRELEELIGKTEYLFKRLLTALRRQDAEAWKSRNRLEVYN